MSLFQGQGLTCTRADRPVFAGLDFDLPAGGALLLTGPNGSGKSSLLRLMAGLLRPSAGQLTWDGADIAQDPEAHRARLRYLGHLDAVKPVLSLRENLAFAAGLHGPVAEAELQNGLAAFALETLAGLPGRVLSAGQRRRLALARLAVSPGTLWLLDEPTVGLDTASQAKLARLMAAHRAQGGRVAAATHVPLDLPGAVTLDLAPHAEAARAAALEHA
jgi:heme exporter protein A